MMKSRTVAGLLGLVFISAASAGPNSALSSAASQEDPVPPPEVVIIDSTSLLQTSSPQAPATVRYTMAVTAYSSSPDETDDTPLITASGYRVRDGVIASNDLPFGTKIKIPTLFGDKVFTVEDRMHRRFANRIDVWMPTKSQALRFGKHVTEIEVLL